MGSLPVRSHQPSSCFRPTVDHLEDRVVPASALDDAFFAGLFDQTVAQAEQQKADVVRVFAGIYQTGQAEMAKGMSELDAQKLLVQQQAQAKADEIARAKADVLRQLKEYEDAVRNRYKDDVGDLQNQAGAAIDNLNSNPPPGATPEAVQQQTGVILAWTRMQYENMTADVTRQMQEVQLQYSQFDAALQAQFKGVVDAATAQYTALLNAQQQLLSAYDSYNIGLLNQAYDLVIKIQTQLQHDLTAIQEAWINSTQIVTEQQLLDSSYYYDDYGYGDYYYSGGSGGNDYGSGRIGFDDGASK